MTQFLVLIALTLGLSGADVATLTLPSGGGADGPSLRELAEIDGDLGTFTLEEHRKFAVLAEVLGADPTLPAPELAQLGS